MADRTVLVRLRAEVGSFVSEMDRATNATERTRRQSEENQQQATGALGQMVRSADEHADAWEAAGATMTVAGAGILAVVGGVQKAYSDFDEAMATVAADTRETGAALDGLRAAAIEAGAATNFSAVEAAQGIDELAKAGVSTSDILKGGLAGSLALAAAGSLDVAKSAEIASAAMVQFRLGGDQVGHIADLLAAGAGKALGSVEDLGAALNQGGLVAAQMGLTIEETTGTLAAFASAGLKGSDAGTSLKTMLLMLANPSEKAARTMSDLGISAYDASGNFVGMTSLAGQLQAKLGPLTQAQRDQAMATIFGSDAIRASNVLFTQGATGINDWINKTNDAGYAAEQTAIKLDTLKGDWEYLLGDLDALALSSGGSVNDWLREIVQNVDDAIVAFSQLPDWVQEDALGLAAIAGAGLLAAGAFVTLFPSILTTVTAFRTLASSNAIAATSMGRVGKVAAGLGVAIAAWAALQVAVDATYDSVNASMSETTTAVLALGTSTESVDAIIRATSDGQWWNFDGLADAAKQLNDPGWEQQANTFLTMGNGADAAKDQIGTLGEALATMVNSGNQELAAEKMKLLTAEWEKGGGTADELLALMPAYTDALLDVENAQAQAAPSAAELAGEVTGVSVAGEDAADAVEGLSDALEAMLSQFFSVDEAADDFQSKLNGLKDVVKENGRELEGTSDKAIANREALRSTADAAANLIQKMAEQGASSEDLKAKSSELRQQFLDQAAAAGFTGSEVDKVAAAYDALPGLVELTLEAKGITEAKSALDGVLRSINQVAGKTFTTYVDVKNTGQVASGRAGVSVARADGGIIPLGLGGPREDNVLTWTSSGEYVINAAATSRYLPLIEAINAQKLADGGVVGGNVSRLLGGASSTSATSAGAYAITTGSILSGLTASDSNPAAASSYAAALDAAAAAAARAEAAERSLDQIRERAQRRLDNMKAQLEANEDAAKEAADAAAEQADAELDALKRRNDDALQALKDRQQAELDAARSKKDNQAATTALQRRQDVEERELKRRLEDEEQAAQDRIAEAKKRNATAAKDLAKANDALYTRAKATAAKEEEAATAKLSAAKDADAAASKAAAEAERILNEQRQKAQQLAEATANSIRKNATLTAALNDRSPATLAAAGTGLSDASRAADAAAAAKRDEKAADAATRRAAALTDLATAAASYADAQRAMGISDVTITANLDQVAAKITDLGARYGLSADAIAKLTGKLADSRATGASILSAFTRQTALAAEFSRAITTLQRAGLSSELLDQVVAGGTTDGLALARAILAGGSGTIAGLNGTQAGLDSYANAAGSTLAAGRYGSGFITATTATGPAITATLSPEAVSVLSSVAQAIASRPNSISIGGRQVFLAVADAAADAAYGAAG